MFLTRSHYCGDINERLVGEEVSLCAWVHRRRDHGGVIFLDMRDREGLVQVVFAPEAGDAFTIADTLRSEFVVFIKGKVRLRPDGMINEELKTDN